MSSQVAGIGVGSFLLFSSWIVALILCLVALRTQKIIGIVALITAGVITLILLTIPRRSIHYVSDSQKESDYHFIWSNTVASFLGFCTVGSFILLFFTDHFTEPVNIPQIRSWVIE